MKMKVNFSWRKFEGRLEAGIFSGLPRAAESAALEVYDAADPGRRDTILWDVEAGEKREWLKRAVAAAAEAVVFFGANMEPLAFAWSAWNGGAKVAQAHFFTAGRPENPGEFIRLYLENTIMDGLIGAIPAPFRGAARLAREAGFRELVTLPKTAWLAARGRAVDLKLLFWEKGKPGG